MVKVELIDWKVRAPLDLASHAALICYQAETPEMGKRIDVEKRLFKVSHHTTLQHTDFTFLIEGIAVSDITFGMHLAHPFYNSDQKSGRYCANMFANPDYEAIQNYVKLFWPEVSSWDRAAVMEYIKNGVRVYGENMGEAIALARDFLKIERPYVSDKYLDQNASKIAQEQMRMFISTIFPTTFDLTINMTVLVAMWESMWTPAGKAITQAMVNAVLEKFPDVLFMFNPERRRVGEWYMDVPSHGSDNMYKPSLKLLGIIDKELFILPKSEVMHPVDKLHFLPEMMDNSFGEIRTEIEVSTATMGQDQRHRTLGRSEPKFTGNFYLPPIPRTLGLHGEAEKLMAMWADVSVGHGTLGMMLAPYGAMVTYKKRGSFNAVAHEQGKRLCWCAQEEIYHLGRYLRFAIEKEDGVSDLLRIFEPPCYNAGKCAEGDRYCGRDLALRKTGDYFPERKV